MLGDIIAKGEQHQSNTGRNRTRRGNERADKSGRQSVSRFKGIQILEGSTRNGQMASRKTFDKAQKRACFFIAM